MSSVQGNTGAVLAKRVFGFDAQTGNFTELTWEGTQDAILGQIPFIGTVANYRTDQKGPRWSLTARYNTITTEGGQETPLREERLHWNRATKSIWNAPNYSDVNSVEKGLLKRTVEAGEDFPQEFFDAVIPPLGPAYIAHRRELFDLAAAGVDSIIIEQPNIVVTQTASAAYPFTPNFAGYGMIFATEDMIADAALSAAWISNLPVFANPAGFVYGWLKSPPDITTVGDNRSQMTQQYEFGLWPIGLYSQV